MEKYKILVPVDFSPRSINALNNAISIAKRIESTITVIHAVMSPVIYDVADEKEEFASGLDTGINHNLDKLLELAPALRDVDHSFLVEYGLSPDAITTYTMQNEVDLIVMGTRGKSEHKKSLLGSITWAVINAVKCPVLAIPEDGNFKDAKKIILAVDYDHLPAFESFEALVKLTNTFGAQLKIIHIGKSKILTEEELSEARILEQYFKGIRHEYKYLKSGNEEGAILKFLKDENAKLLAIISKKYSIVEKLQNQSLTKKMIRDLKTPLLILHDN